MKNKLIKTIVVCLVVVAVGFGGFYGYNALFGKKAAVAAVQYYTVSAKRMNLQTSIQGTGAAYAASTKDVSPGSSGTLKDLSVKAGDTVAVGQKLFVSDSDDVRKNVTNAQNNLEKQKLTLASDQNAQKVDENKVAMDELSVSDAEAQLVSANQKLSDMTVKASIAGVVTAVNNINGDSVQQGNAVLTIVDMDSMKVKVSVDELDIDNVKVGQKAQIKFDAIKDKTYEGTVETIAQVGKSSNNVTTYDVNVDIDDPSGIRLGMNGNITILVENKENALVIPAEALVENNGQTYVRVESTNSTGQTGTQTPAAGTQGQTGTSQSGTQTAGGRNAMQLASGSGKLVAIKTGLETENYIEVTEGLTEGEKVLVQLPQTSSTASTNNRNSFGGFGGSMGGFGGNMGGRQNQSGNNSSGSRNGSSSGANSSTKN